ncbi:DUF6372 family protein [Streptomyces sp. NPDC002537]
MAVFAGPRRVSSQQIASMEQIEACHCLCAVAHRGHQVCSEDACPDLRLTFHLPVLGEVSFPVCGPCFDAAQARWHRWSAA